MQFTFWASFPGKLPEAVLHIKGETKAVEDLTVRRREPRRGVRQRKAAPGEWREALGGEGKAVQQTWRVGGPRGPAGRVWEVEVELEEH